MNGFSNLLGIEHVGRTDEGFVIAMEIDKDKHHHEAGMVHGGVYLSLLDSVVARAMHSEFPEVVYTPTLNLNVQFFRPAQSGTIRAVGTIINKSRSVCCVEGRLYNDEGKLLAQGVGNLFIKDKRPN
jgi:uncharacterized protein (TIGR00369 family)